MQKTKHTKRVTKVSLLEDLTDMQAALDRALIRVDDEVSTNKALYSRISSLQNRLTTKSMSLTRALKRIDILQDNWERERQEMREAIDYAESSRADVEGGNQRLRRDMAVLVNKLTHANALLSMQTASRDATRAALHIVVHGDPHVIAEPAVGNSMNGYRMGSVGRDDELSDIKTATILDQGRDDFDPEVQDGK
jgi:chromosome segregation ATPase